LPFLEKESFESDFLSSVSVACLASISATASLFIALRLHMANSLSKKASSLNICKQTHMNKQIYENYAADCKENHCLKSEL